MSKIMISVVLSALVVFGGTLHIQAQSNESLNSALRIQMKGIAKRYQDSVVLRWAPGNAALWRMSRTQGFLIERAEVVGGNVGAYRALTPKPLLQWSQQEWSTVLQTYPYADSTEEQLIAVAVEMSEQSGVPTDMVIRDLSDLDALRENKTRLETAFTFALIVAERSRVAANGLAMRFVDPSVDVNNTYRYRISMIGSTTPYIVAPAIIEVGPYRKTSTERTVGLAAEGLDTKAMLVWANNTGHTTFDVYRSDDGRTFAKLNTAPIMTLRSGTLDSESNGYIDSGLVNYRTYTYRIVGHNSFAEEEILGAIQVMPRDLTAPPTPSGVRTEHIGTKDVSITWDMPSEPTPDLDGFYVQRARAEDGPYSLVNVKPLTADSRRFIDTSAILGDTLYYQVVSVDTAKNGSLSFPVYVAFADSIAPSSAVLVRGSIDTAGIVRIVVQHPPDTDVMGYRLLVANDSTHEFTVKRELFDEDSMFVRSDTILVDTIELRTLTKFVYYRVVTLDWHYNESDVSNMLVLPRPDIIPPVSPVITDYVVTDTTIIVSYNPSTSRDVSHHVILRRPFSANGAIEPAWDSLARGGVRDSMLIDSAGVRSATYQYAVVAYDSAGNRSPLSNIVTLVRYDNGIRPPVTDLRVTYDSTARTNLLEWNYTNIGEPHSFLIYKRLPGGTLGSYAIVKDRTLREFLDTKQADARATYGVKVVCQSGAESSIVTITPRP
ncbi:MAG: hypothetical protein IPH85_14085 [Ignavibacteria bacterium]|nr:hypothetical protein [Ignavibacteria bacterium]